MSLGTAIFLASLLISLVVLYTRTKDRWNWKKIFKTFSFILVGIPSLIGIIVWCANYYNDLPKVVNELQGIKLGYKKSDVVFKLGKHISRKKAVAELEERREVSEDIQSLKEEIDHLEEDIDHLTAFPGREAEKEHLHYQNLIITLQNDKVIEIRYLCKRCDEDSYALNRIKCGESSEDVLRRYGSNITQFNNKTDACVRIYQSKKYNFSYMLRRDEVIALIVGCVDFNQNENFAKEVK